jgi:uncharacterized Zn finger protein
MEDAMSFWMYRPYVSVAERRLKAAREIIRRGKKGQKTEPVQLAGKKIATTFWGKAWCDNLEAYSDFSNRMPRGRTYVRNGSVFDLKIARGQVKASVMGSELYEIQVDIDPLPARQWNRIKSLCAGQIGSLIELLQGRLSEQVMKIVTDLKDGLFPSPKQIHLDCSCPDWADMCKHVAASLYGVGARLDQKPELLFLLRGVDPTDLIAAAAPAKSLAAAGQASKKRRIAKDQLAEVFGIELDSPAPPAEPVRPAVKVELILPTKKPRKKRLAAVA